MQMSFFTLYVLILKLIKFFSCGTLSITPVSIYRYCALTHALYHLDELIHIYVLILKLIWLFCCGMLSITNLSISDSSMLCVDYCAVPISLEVIQVPNVFSVICILFYRYIRHGLSELCVDCVIA